MREAQPDMASASDRRRPERTGGGGDVVLSLSDALCAWAHDRAFAKTGNAELADWRDDLLAGARGHVLEVGARVGANLRRYGAGVDTLTVTEWRPALFHRLARRSAEQTRTTTALRAPPEDLPFNDATFDAVVSAFALCRTDDQPRALREIHRVLRPGGALVFIEHVRAGNPRLRNRQDRCSGVRRCIVGCDADRPTLDSIRAAGFKLTDVRRIEVPERGVARPHVAGTATPIPGGRFVAPHQAARRNE